MSHVTTLKPHQKEKGTKVSHKLSPLSPEVSVWVEASAGTGKTKLLTDRVLSLLLHGVSPEKILCITFTKAAANEMLLRIQGILKSWMSLPRDRLRAAISPYVEPTSEKLQLAEKLNTLISPERGSLSIQTIHSLCHLLLTQNSFEADLLPGFELCDEEKTRDLWKHLFEEISYNAKEDFELLSRYVSYERLLELTRYLLDCLSLNPVSTDLDQQKKHSQFELNLDTQWAAVFNQMNNILKDVHAQQYQVPILDIWKEKWQACSDSTDRIKLLKQLVLTKSGGKRKRLLPASITENNPHIYHSIETLAQDVEDLKGAEKLAQAIHASKALFRLYACLYEEYQTYKSVHNILSYDDLIDRTLRLLTNERTASWIMYKMNGGWDHILIDEAQDTNQKQWRVIRGLTAESLSGEGGAERTTSLFVVGDEKQSIFSFQGANPQIYQENKKFFKEKITALNKPWLVHRLQTSYRSTQAIVDTVKNVFSRGKVFSDRVVEQIKENQIHRIGQLGLVELWPLTPAPDAFEPQPWVVAQEGRALSAEGTLALKIAHTIKKWLQEGRPLKSHHRLVQPKDIMILLRRRGTFMENLIRALRYYDVPVSGHDRLMLSSHIIVQDLLALAQVLLLPCDDLKLAIILKSPLLEWSEEDLYDLAQKSQEIKKSLLETLELFQDVKRKWASTWAYIENLKRIVDQGTPADSFFGSVLFEHHGWEKFISRLGKESTDVLTEFLEVCDTFVQERGPSLEHFVHWMESAQYEVKRNMDSAHTNEVRIMTVHGSKGLQAPIVFLPDTTQVPTTANPFLFEVEGLELKEPLWLIEGVRKLPLLEDAMAAEKRAQLSEYYRLLYVALTRAEDELYIAGAEPTRTLDEKSWYALIEKIHQM